MKSILTILLCSVIVPFAHAQGPLSLTLQQAMDMAAQQSYQVQASVLEARKAEARIKEVMAIGLPQVDVSASLNNYLTVPTSVIPNFTGEGPEYLQIQFGVPWSTTATAQLNQLIFDGSYLVAVKATRELRLLSEQELERTRSDARNQAAKSYLGVLAAREGAKLSAESVPVLEKSHTEASAMVEQGFMEATDVDRLSIALASARDRARSFAQQERVALAYLRLVLGVPADTPLTLVDELGTIVNDPAELALSSDQLAIDGHIDYQVAGTTMRVQEMQVKNEKAAYLPKLYGFASHQEQRFGFDQPFETEWFPATLWGLQLQVPIFSSGMRSSKVKQATLTLDQTRVNLTATDQRLKVEAEERSEKAVTALESYLTEKENLALSRRIFDRSSIKFTNGLASSFELNQDQSQFLQAQQIYIGKLVDLLLARTDLRKALDLY